MSLEHPATLTEPAELAQIDLQKVDAVQMLVRNERPFDPWNPDVYFQVISAGEVISFDYFDAKDACLAFLARLDAAHVSPSVDREQLELAEKSIETEIFKLWKRTTP